MFAALSTVAVLSMAASPTCDIPTILAPSNEQFSLPSDASATSAWQQALKQWRTDCKAAINYNGSIYKEPALQWTRYSYIQPQSHPYDNLFYNVTRHAYTIDLFLDDLERRYGGIDSVLVWPTYTNIGIDDRNQFDLIRAMPGGVPAIRTFVRALHARGVKVLWPYNPWDTGTRRPDEGSDEKAMARLLAETEADGFNGDTMSFIPQGFYTESVAAGRPAALEPEGGGGGDLSSFNWDTMGWGYWQYPFRPMVSKWKWLEPRFMVHVCDRWNKNKTDNLQAAFFNGVGYESWENVWGTWNGITPRDAEAIRRVGTLLRFF